MDNFLIAAKEFCAEYWIEVKTLLYALFAFLELDINVVNVVMWLMIIDTASGIMKAIAVDKVMFNFKYLYVGILSKFVVLLIPMTLALMARGIGYDFKWAVEIVLRLIILSEGISIITNAISIKDNEVLKNRDYLSLMLNFIRKKLIELFDKTINK